jgi:G3E family GTPase
MIPLLVVTGFLGAGKTTFLRGLLPAVAQRGLKARVVLNDFQDARVDSATLADVAPDLVALSSTCVCCESLEEMTAALASITRRGPDAREIAIVEANGGTEAGELIALLGSEPALDHLSPPLQLTIIDAKRFGTRGWQNEMEREQLVTATHVAIGRLDLVTPARAAEVRAAVSALAPRAAWVDPQALAGLLDVLEGEVSPIPARTQRGPAAAGHVHHDSDRHFASLLVELPRPVEPAAFLAFLHALPAEVVRAKGIVILTDPPGEKRSFQKVDTEAEISPCELAEPEKLPPRAIFIGPQLPEALIEERLGPFLNGDGGGR